MPSVFILYSFKCARGGEPSLRPSTVEHFCSFLPTCVALRPELLLANNSPPLPLPLANSSPNDSPSPSCRTPRLPLVQNDHSSYDAYTGTTAAECCAECLADKTLCSGYSFAVGSAGPDVDIDVTVTTPPKNQCTLVNAWHTSNLKPGNCTSGRVNDRSVVPPPPAHPYPKGAKNVVFLVADDMRPSLNVHGLRRHFCCGSPGSNAHSPCHRVGHVAVLDVTG